MSEKKKDHKKVVGKVYDVKLFTRLMGYAKHYKLQFNLSVLAVLSVALLAAVRPVLLKRIIDDFIFNKDAEQLVVFTSLMLFVLVMEVIFQFLFIYFANWLGQSIIRDMRTQLFKHLLNFKMQYYNKSAVGKLVTRVVSDIETIASVFGQGLFMIISDLLKMFVIAMVMLYMNWQLALIVFAILPVLIFATKIQKMVFYSFRIKLYFPLLNLFTLFRIFC